MANLVFNIAAKIFTINECLGLLPGQSYSDSILRNTAYTNTLAGTKLKIRNKCTTGFTLPAQTIFVDNVNGGDFTAAINATLISASTTVDVDVRYTGTYRGPNNNPSYSLSIYGSTASYALVVSNPDTPPTTSNVTINLANRINTEVTKDDLSYNDVDGVGTITHVRFNGNVGNLYTNAAMTTPYVAGTELPINTFILYFKAPDTDAASSITATYDVKANNVWST